MPSLGRNRLIGLQNYVNIFLSITEKINSGLNSALEVLSSQDRQRSPEASGQDNPGPAMTEFAKVPDEDREKHFE